MKNISEILEIFNSSEVNWNNWRSKNQKEITFENQVFNLENQTRNAKNIIFKNCIWKDGILINGTWEYGTWENGIWKNGTWLNGVWENGTWLNGVWKNGIWKKGFRLYHRKI